MIALAESRLRGGAALVAALFVAACTGGGSSPATASDSPPLATAPAPPTAMPDPSPQATVIDGLTVTTMSLGPNAAPIDVVSAFGSIWVADHRANAVSRVDPATLAEVARIDVGSGPGWFAVTDDAVWVTNQMGRGLTRIDPAANTADIRAGDWATCGSPVVALGYIWQVACDAGVVMQIDPATNRSSDIYVRDVAIGFVDGTVYAVGRDAVSAIDPATGKLEKVADGTEGFPLAADERSVWLAGAGEVLRVSLPDGEVLGHVAIAGEVTVTIAEGRAWVTQFGLALHEVDTSTYESVRTLHVNMPSVAREIDGTVWVTSFDANTLSRFQP